MTYSKKEVECKDIKVASLLDVQQTEEILERLWLLPVLHGKNKVKVGLVILRGEPRSKESTYRCWL